MFGLDCLVNISVSPLVKIINWDIWNVKIILFLLKIQFMRFLFVILFSNEIFKLNLEQEFHIEISN